MRAMLDYTWPGNLRELANLLERAQILAEDDLITPDDLPETMFATSPTPTEAALTNPLNLAQQERRTVQEALHQTKGNKVQAARLLGVSRRALYRLLAHHGLEEARPALGGGPTESTSE